jgi:putative transposon-encoded protein
MKKVILNKGPACNAAATMTNVSFEGRKKDHGIGTSGKVPVPKIGGSQI